MSESAVQINQLSKRFGRNKVLKPLDLTVPIGSIFGLVGMNGAGKTTLIRMIMGHLHPSGGNITVLGQGPWYCPESVRSRIAYVSENMNLPRYMTPEKAVALGAKIYSQWDAPLAERLLDDFDLRGKGAFKTLSKGQKRKVCILLAICQNADLLVMDEPASGLDVVARREFLDQVLETACRPGRTVLLSSHLLSDLERVIDRLAMIHQGRLVMTGDLESLKSSVRKIHFQAKVTEEELQDLFHVVRVEPSQADETLVTVTDFTQEKMDRLIACSPQAQNADVMALNLEDIFVELAGSKSTVNPMPQEVLS